MLGAGKSTLANVLLGQDPLCHNCTFTVCNGTDSCTKETTYAAGIWLGSGIDFTVVDTPGFTDSNDDDAANIEKMMDVLHNTVQSTSAIVLVIKSLEFNSFGEGFIYMIQELTKIFGEDIWGNVIIEASFWKYDQISIDGRTETCSSHPDDCRNEEWFVNEINRQLQERTHLNHNLSAVFIDSWSQTPAALDDETQQFFFKQETTKLFDFIQSKEEFPLRTINDLKKEIQWLNNVIEQNITEIESDIIVIETDIDENESKIINVQDDILEDESEIEHNKINIRHNRGLIDEDELNIINNAHLFQALTIKIQVKNM